MFSKHRRAEMVWKWRVKIDAMQYLEDIQELHEEHKDWAFNHIREDGYVFFRAVRRTWAPGGDNIFREQWPLNSAPHIVRGHLKLLGRKIAGSKRDWMEEALAPLT